MLDPGVDGVDCHTHHVEPQAWRGWVFGPALPPQALRRANELRLLFRVDTRERPLESTRSAEAHLHDGDDVPELNEQINLVPADPQVALEHPVPVGDEITLSRPLGAVAGLLFASGRYVPVSECWEVRSSGSGSSDRKPDHKR